MVRTISDDFERKKKEFVDRKVKRHKTSYESRFKTEDEYDPKIERSSNIPNCTIEEHISGKEVCTGLSYKVAKLQAERLAIKNKQDYVIHQFDKEKVAFRQSMTGELVKYKELESKPKVVKNQAIDKERSDSNVLFVGPIEYIGPIVYCKDGRRCIRRHIVKNGKDDYKMVDIDIGTIMIPVREYFETLEERKYGKKG